MSLASFVTQLPTPRRRTRSRATFTCSTSPPRQDTRASSPAATLATPGSPPIVFVLGGPGSGKGTQCALLQQHLQLAQLCVGDLLRREAATGSEAGRSIAETMQRGDIVPGHVTMSLLRRELSLLSGQCVGVLIDGFPRAMDQARQFEQLVTTCEFVLYFKCDPVVMVDRLRHRAETSGRADDVEDVFRKRLDTFHNKTVPVIEHYRERDMLREVDSECGDIDTVFKETLRHFEDVIRKPVQ